MARVCLTSAWRCRSSSCCSASDRPVAASSISFLLISSSFWSRMSARLSSRLSCSRKSRRTRSISASRSSRRLRTSSLAASSACLRIVSASRLALARICSASPRAVLRAQPRDQVRADEPDQHTQKAARRSRSGKLLQVAVRPDRELASSAINLSGGAGEKVYGRRQRLKRSANASPWPARRSSPEGNIG